jgi:hypothetical protein
LLARKYLNNASNWKNEQVEKLLDSSFNFILHLMRDFNIRIA